MWLINRLVSQNFLYEVTWRLKIFLSILQRDILVMRPVLKNRALNIIWWSALVIYVFEYVGLSSAVGFGLFIAVSECACKGYLRATRSAGRIVADIHGAKTLFYYLSLPIEPSLVFLSYICSTALELMFIDIWVFPVAKLVLGSSFELSLLGGVKAAVVFVCAHFFYATCTLFYVSCAFRSRDDLAILFPRFEILFFTGGYFFTWYQVFSKSHFFGYLFLCNPMIYASEGMRAAVLNTPESLNVWLCCGMLLIFTFVLGFWGIRRMKQKLDCL